MEGTLILNMKNHWLEQAIRYYGFVKSGFKEGMLSLIGREPVIVETYFSVMPSDNLEKLESLGDWYSIDNYATLWGQLGRCYQLINFASGGLYWDDDLKKKVFNGPKEFTMHIWARLDEYNYKSISDLTFKGIKWLNVAHAGSDGASDCWGLASFTYEERIKNVCYKPMECKIPIDIEYPSFRIGELMMEHAKEIEEINEKK